MFYTSIFQEAEPGAVEILSPHQSGAGQSWGGDLGFRSAIKDLDSMLRDRLDAVDGTLRSMAL